MIQAIIDGRSWSKANTRVEDEGDVKSIYLHDNKIASIEKGQLFINHCGWKTVTTKSRLNALISFIQGELSGIYQKNFEWIVRRVDNSDGSVYEYPMPNGWLLV